MRSRTQKSLLPPFYKERNDSGDSIRYFYPHLKPKAVEILRYGKIPPGLPLQKGGKNTSYRTLFDPSALHPYYPPLKKGDQGGFSLKGIP